MFFCNFAMEKLPIRLRFERKADATSKLTEESSYLKILMLKVNNSGFSTQARGCHKVERKIGVSGFVTRRRCTFPFRKLPPGQIFVLANNNNHNNNNNNNNLQKHLHGTTIEPELLNEHHSPIATSVTSYKT